jgi:enamine deaminase RidA (YjgF/YER057c/UK114 family)
MPISTGNHHNGITYLIGQPVPACPKKEKQVSKPQPIYPAGRQALYEINRYSAAIRSGDLLFVSGQVGSREDGTPEPEFQKQVALAFANLNEVLKSAGCTIDDIVDVTTFHTDPETQFGVVLSAKDKVFSTKPYPNWTAVGVNRLAGFDFEIKVIARVPGTV